MTHRGFGWRHNYAMINNIQMHYVEQAAVGDAAGCPVIFCHGFPGLWFGWHRQIPALAAAGYRVIAPDMRGMGQTEAPPEPASYDIDHITGDLLGLLDHIGIERAVFAGLDIQLTVHDPSGFPVRIIRDDLSFNECPEAFPEQLVSFVIDRVHDLSLTQTNSLAQLAEHCPLRSDSRSGELDRFRL